MTAALLLIVVLPFIQIFIQRLRRIDEGERRLRIKIKAKTSDI